MKAIISLLPFLFFASFVLGQTQEELSRRGRNTIDTVEIKGFVELKHPNFFIRWQGDFWVIDSEKELDELFEKEYQTEVKIAHGDFVVPRPTKPAIDFERFTLVGRRIPINDDHIRSKSIKVYYLKCDSVETSKECNRHVVHLILNTYTTSMLFMAKMVWILIPKRNKNEEVEFKVTQYNDGK